MKIAFCTTNKNRTFHLRQTLPRNLADNPNGLFVVLDFGSTDDCQEFLSSIKCDRLKVYRYETTGPFRMSFAKNMAHRCAMLEGADILVNVDADNFIGPGFDDFLAREFEAIPGVYFQANMIKGKMTRGISGRIAVDVPSFLKTGGYDEAKFAHWGSDDKDISLRLRAMGYDHIEIPPSFLRCIQHNDKVRFRDYPEAARLEAKYFEVSHETIGKLVVNDGQVGCGTVYRNGLAIELGPIPTRIFGIGMHKTATTSLHKALIMLGYDSAHWKSGTWARDVLNEMQSIGRSPTLERHYAASDLPIPMLFKELDVAYPGSKFVLTVRDELKWLNSVRKHWSYRHNRYRWQWDVYPINNRMHKLLYGRTSFDPDVMLARYRRHNAEVREYFKHRPDDLLVMDMDVGAGWRELCGFLGDPLLTVAYPREFVTPDDPMIELKEDMVIEYGPYEIAGKIGGK